MRASLLRIARSLLRIVGLSFLALAGYLYFAQDAMIYLPRPYAVGLDDHLPAGWQLLHFQTSQGAQIAYFHPPAQPGRPRRTWACFGGNASLAQSWIPLLGSALPATDAALLIEYPGYGSCAGHPSPASILENSEDAANALAIRLQIPRAELEKTWSLIGHSLGAATALQFAAHHPAHRIVLFAPFTTMVQMARRQVGWPLAELCRSRFDNPARLRELAAQPAPPPVLIFHGVDDAFIPLAMSRALAVEFPSLVALREVAGADHNSIIVDTMPAWHAALNHADE